MSDHTVKVENGKYTFIVRGLSIAINRYGEPWHEQQDAFNALHSIVAELDAARVVVEAARRLDLIGEAPLAIRDALQKHSRLVSDNEKPSEWCGGAA